MSLIVFSLEIHNAVVQTHFVLSEEESIRIPRLFILTLIYLFVRFYTCGKFMCISVIGVIIIFKNLRKIRVNREYL